MYTNCFAGGTLLGQDAPSLSVAAMPYYVLWAESGCATAETETPDCSAYKSAAAAQHGNIKFPERSDADTMTGQQNVEFRSTAGRTVINCSTEVPLQCQIAVEGPLKGETLEWTWYVLGPVPVEVFGL